jgi:hypothetical protein
VLRDVLALAPGSPEPSEGNAVRPMAILLCIAKRITRSAQECAMVPREPGVRVYMIGEGKRDKPRPAILHIHGLSITGWPRRPVFRARSTTTTLFLNGRTA